MICRPFGFSNNENGRARQSCRRKLWGRPPGEALKPEIIARFAGSVALGAKSEENEWGADEDSRVYPKNNNPDNEYRRRYGLTFATTQLGLPVDR